MRIGEGMKKGVMQIYKQKKNLIYLVKLPVNRPGYILSWRRYQMTGQTARLTLGTLHILPGSAKCWCIWKMPTHCSILIPWVPFPPSTHLPKPLFSIFQEVGKVTFGSFGNFWESVSPASSNSVILSPRLPARRIHASLHIPKFHCLEEAPTLPLIKGRPEQEVLYWLPCICVTDPTLICHSIPLIIPRINFQVSRSCHE